MAVVLGQHLDRPHYDYAHEFAMVTAPSHPSTRKLIVYWRACEARGGMLMGRDIPARAIAPLLKDIVVAEPIGDWEDARMRLAGFGMAQYFGRDVTGALMSEILAGNPKDTRMMLAGARHAIARNCPGTLEHWVRDGAQLVVRQEMTALPLYAPDGDARWILVGTFNF
jgi:hypothetical protein